MGYALHVKKKFVLLIRNSFCFSFKLNIFNIKSNDKKLFYYSNVFAV